MSDELQAGPELDTKLANLLGDDLKARHCEEDIVAALFSKFKYRCWGGWRCFYTLTVGKESWQVDCVDTSLVTTHNKRLVKIYKERKGKSYAAALDQAIAVYRRTPPAYSTDGNETFKLIAEMKKRGWRGECGDEPDHKPYGYFSIGNPLKSRDIIRTADTLQEAVALAAYIALSLPERLAPQESQAQ